MSEKKKEVKKGKKIDNMKFEGQNTTGWEGLWR